MKLNSIRISSLTLLEAGQFVNSQLTDISNMGGTGSITEEGLSNYLSKLESHLSALNNAILVVRKSDETVKIEEEDAKRDQALLLLKRAASIFELSDLVSERDAATSLKNLFRTYKGLASLNYQAESLGIDNLINDLGNSKYASLIDQLNLSQFVNRLSEANNTFKELFSGRNLEATQKGTFDAKKIKNEMLATYTDFAGYVLSMAKLDNGAQFYKDMVGILNTNRSYFAGVLARRKGAVPEAV